MELSRTAKQALERGHVKLRVMRSGMFQQLTFTARRVRLGNIEYNELYTDRQVDVSELTRVANEVGLPVEGKNGRAFPKGMSASDFQIAVSSSSSSA